MGACDSGDIHLTKEPKKANREIAAFSVPLAVCSEAGPFFPAFISPIPSAEKFLMFRFLPLSSCTQADVVPLALPPALTASRFGSERGWLLLCYVKWFRHLPNEFLLSGTQVLGIQTCLCNPTRFSHVDFRSRHSKKALRRCPKVILMLLPSSLPRRDIPSLPSLMSTSPKPSFFLLLYLFS